MMITNRKISNQTQSSLGSLRHQSGVYTLVIASILIAATTLAVRGVTRSSILETRITANEVRIKEVGHAAEATLDWAIAWYMENEPTWVGDPTDLSVPEEFVLTGMPAITSASSGSYTGGAVFRRIPIDPAVPETELANGYVLIIATATASSDSAVTATVRQYVHDNLLLANPDFDAPPLVLEGCISGITGTPDIDPGPPPSTAIATADDDTGNACIDLGHLNVNGGDIEDNSFTPGTLWSQIFNDISKDDMRAISDAENAAGIANTDSDRTVIWVDDSGNYNPSDLAAGKVLGSPENPVIVIFSETAVCPKANGGMKVYGIVYFDTTCEDANGWGGLKVVGTVAVKGDLKDGSANSLIQNWNDFGGDDPYNLKTPWIARVPGSWRDF
jgi:hypothetical protein